MDYSFVISARLSMHRVFVVDDDQDSAQTLAVILRLWGHDVRVQPGGLEALRESSAFRPEVAILDLALPGLDGYEVARRLREIPGLEKIRLIALSGYCREIDRQRAFEAGFDEHLAKPADLDKIRLLVDSAYPIQTAVEH